MPRGIRNDGQPRAPRRTKAEMQAARESGMEAVRVSTAKRTEEGKRFRRTKAQMQAFKAGDMSMSNAALYAARMNGSTALTSATPDVSPVVIVDENEVKQVDSIPEVAAEQPIIHIPTVIVSTPVVVPTPVIHPSAPAATKPATPAIVDDSVIEKMVVGCEPAAFKSVEDAARALHVVSAFHQIAWEDLTPATKGTLMKKAEETLAA